MKPGLLQLGNGAGHTGRQHDAFDQMISRWAPIASCDSLSRLIPFSSSFAVCSQIALWQAINTTPRCCRPGMVSAAGPNTLFGPSCGAVSVGTSFASIGVCCLRSASSCRYRRLRHPAPRHPIDPACRGSSAQS
jgi:hypothetical protein